ncbi:T9SS type A sorting domain-containing protein [Marinilabilia sp.]|uniref:T9SS type A sorting domain-containing protein n=1 Tax=Marinilabilia sp. TaxID=2021252 RepID=UPI0025BF0457|nr:T9SS type A sorting domain-containing protein [Marinilabilia sp.]
MNKRLLTLVVFALFAGTSLFSQTTLTAGDIAFVGINADGSDDFSFLLLKDIEVNTVLKITDQGWSNTSNSFYVTSGDETLIWTATSNMASGSIIHITTAANDGTTLDPDVASVGSLTGNTTIGSFGDQVFIYQGTSTSPTFITGIHFNVEPSSNTSDWDGMANSTGTTQLPPQLTNGVNAIWVHNSGVENDNFIYNGAITFGNAATLNAAINDVSNWSFDNTIAFSQTPFPVTFTVLPPCIEPDVPTVTTSPNPICSGSYASLNISGNLNDATSWYVYTGSCGGTLIGTTATSSFDVAPTTPTTYYVRGEGGCITPGSCGTASISFLNPTTITTQPIPLLSSCEGGPEISISVSASGSGILSYQWYNTNGAISGANASSLAISTSPSNSGVYYCVVTGDCGSATSGDSNVTISPTYNLTENDFVCFGDSYTFPDGTTQNNIVSQVIYTSNLLTETSSCDSVIVTTVDVTSVDASVTQSGATLTANVNGAEYQWLDCNNSYAIIPAETNQTFTPAVSGSYAVEVVDNGCVGTSDCISVVPTAIHENTSDYGISISPNPTNGIFEIDLGREHSDITLTVRNIIGKVIVEKNYVKATKISFDLEKELDGLYILEVSTKLNKNVFKIMKR